MKKLLCILLTMALLAGCAAPAVPTTVPTTTEPEGGCASSVGLASILLITGIASGAAICVSRRKKED